MGIQDLRTSAAVTVDGRGGSLGRPTIRDVARQAGVSYGTVSRYLNGHKWVSASSASAIGEAIESVGYRANRYARSLATGRSSTIAFLLTEPQDRLFGDPNYATLLREVSSALASRGFTLILMTANTDEERAGVVDFVVGHVDGVLLASSHDGDPILHSLAAARVPTVVCGRLLADVPGEIVSVSADDRAGARAATAHLLSLGRTRVATITGPLDQGGAHDRLRGYYDALEEAGIPIEPELVVSGDWTHGSGRQAMTQLLNATPDIDGLFGGNDAMSVGAVAALRAQHLRVPDDVAVVGFDDTGLAATCDPPLTTIRQPFHEIGGEMVRLLCDGLPTDKSAIQIPTRLVVRESAPTGL